MRCVANARKKKSQKRREGKSGAAFEKERGTRRRLTASRKSVKALKIAYFAYFWNADSTGTPRQACGRGAPSAQAIVAATSK